MKRLMSIEVRGREKAWGFLFEGDPAHLPDWLADGLEVYEVCNVIPEWVQRLGLTRLWCRVQDAWRWMRLW